MLKLSISIDEAVDVLKLLSDKTRLTIMKVLDSGESCCVCEFVEMFHTSQPAISQHLRKLKAAGLVEEERKGQWNFYSINKSNTFYPFVQKILIELPHQNEKIQELEEKGTRITCC